MMTKEGAELDNGLPVSDECKHHGKRSEEMEPGGWKLGNYSGYVLVSQEIGWEPQD